MNNEEEEGRQARITGRELMIRPGFNLVPIQLPDRRAIIPSIRCRFYNTTGRDIDVIWIRQVFSFFMF